MRRAWCGWQRRDALGAEAAEREAAPAERAAERAERAAEPAERAAEVVLESAPVQADHWLSPLGLQCPVFCRAIGTESCTLLCMAPLSSAASVHEK